MKKLSRIGFMAIALAFVLSMLAVTETKAQAVNEILKRMDDHNKALKSLRTNVTYANYDSVLQDTDKREGKAVYLPANGKRYIRIDWKAPEESLAVIGKEYTLYQPNLKVAHTGSTDKVGNSSKVSSPLAFLSMSKEELKANYDIKYMGEEKVNGTTSAWHLELTPKTKQKYKKADIWVDGNGMPIQMKLTADNNDTTSVLLTGFEKNVKIDPSVFSINPANGTKVIKD